MIFTDVHTKAKGKGKFFPVQAVEALRFARV
jgi:hypothetical protein